MTDSGTDPIDLSPRAARPRRRSRWVSVAVVVALVAAVAVLVNGLGDESLFFRPVDEAIAERDDLAEREFRLQGVVVPGTVTDRVIDEEPSVVFTVEFDGARADIVHQGDPALLFQDGIPVVLTGLWAEGRPEGVERFPCGANDGYWFDSSEMLVKHDNEYVAANEENIAEARRQLDVVACTDA